MLTCEHTCIHTNTHTPCLLGCHASCSLMCMGKLWNQVWVQYLAMMSLMSMITQPEACVCSVTGMSIYVCVHTYGGQRSTVGSLLRCPFFLLFDTWSLTFYASRLHIWSAYVECMYVCMLTEINIGYDSLVVIYTDFEVIFEMVPCWLGTHQVGKAGWLVSPWDLCFSLPITGITTECTVLSFTWVVRSNAG